MTAQKLKILLSAFVCHPDKGSEEGVGWNWLKELAKEHEVYALISDFLGQEEPVRAAVDRLPYRDNIHLIFIPMPQGSKLMMALFPRFEFYNLCVEWQKQAFIEAQELLETVTINIVHHVTYGSWTIPSYLSRLPKPFILGPVTGSQSVPLVGYSFLPAKGIAQEMIRMAYFVWTRLTSAAASETVRKAELVLCGNLETLNEIRRMRDSETTFLMSDSGIPKLPEGLSKTEKPESAEICLLWAGLIEPRKNFGLLLQALQRLPSNISWRLLVVGGGVLLPYWKKKVIQAGLQSKIEFLGQVPYREMSGYYQQADIFVFPSLREGSPNVILEAMAYKLPVIGLKLNGTATVLSEGCGILVHVGSKKQIVHDFASAITSLAEASELRRKIGEKGYERVKSLYTWEQRGKKMSFLYQSVLNTAS
ncbi:glycosyltransferase [Leptolyngbya sp. FACHB-17]|uniref:glycosyltransferase family 4 protein n=1 Tax=unclassified Leptolyngbya TaxID=2650499 RepID=UPI00167FFE54|nr:glycosyltransferase [Leptolyngbya sp. FACHB-17]MBD2080450.1 glycosyltransferase family 4 protein [Leptolyngbya sp. FACHB-17]